jgi:phosphoglycolate phosphatase-like HAD superfamily hydrolase
MGAPAAARSAAGLPATPSRAAYRRSMREISALMLDIDGVLTVSWRPLPGAVEAVTRLRGAGLAVARGRPDHVIDSVAGLRGLLGRTG